LRTSKQTERKDKFMRQMYLNLISNGRNRRWLRLYALALTGLALALSLLPLSNVPNAQAAVSGTLVAWGRDFSGQNTIPSGLNKVKAIAVGNTHSLALKADGTVVAWGTNGFGQTDIPSGLNGVSTISAGAFHSLALKANGTVVAWGQDFHGQTSVPSGLSNVKAVAAGEAHSLALKVDGTVVAWGENFYGQGSVPSWLNGVKAVAVGGLHNLALKADGTVVAWGFNNNGQTTVPTGLSGVKAIAAGSYHSLALKADGTVVAWGNNLKGQTTIPGGLTGVIAIAAGGSYNLALKADGTVVGWGDNSFGQISIPTGLNGVTAIAAGFENSLVLRGAGGAVAWGNNTNGQVSIPTSAKSNVKAIVGGDEHALALKNNGTVIGWGRNTRGQVTIPAGLTDVVAIAAGGFHSVALKSNGTVVAWGNNDYGQSSVPAGLTGVVAIAAGSDHTVVLKSDGMVVGWAFRYIAAPSGLGSVTAIAAELRHSLALKSDGTVVGWGNASLNAPSDLNRVTGIATAPTHSLALRANGTVAAWGSNSSGQTSVPSDLNSATGIWGGELHSLALKADGTLATWGSSAYGLHIAPGGLNPFIVISARKNVSLALTQKNITKLTVTPVSATYGANNLTLTATLSDAADDTAVSGKILTFKLNGQTVGTATTNSSGTATLANVRLAGINVGNYSAGVSVSFAADDDNSGANVSNTLTVSKAPLTVTADNKSRHYGQSNPTFTVSYSGFVNGETSSVLSGSPACTTTATITSTVAGSPYSISCTPGTLSATNYNITTPFGAGVLTVTTAPTSLSVQAASGMYSGTTIFSATLTSLGNPLSNQNLSFSLLGTPVANATTDANGRARIENVRLNGTPVGTYANGIGVSFTGDGNYAGSSGAGCLEVTQCDYLLVNTSIDDGCGSLRQAIIYANSRIDTQPLTITLATGYVTLTTALPVINNTGSNQLTIAGTCTVDPATGRGKPGTLISPATGVTINTAGLRLTNSTAVRGVELAGFGGNGISINGTNNLVSCSWIG
jgi:alpha-tubulin suppressor-like RCC1 family protein